MGGQGRGRAEGARAALVEIGSPEGILDARDALERGPVQLITDPSLSAHNPDNPTHTAGTTFMGQFMDHDMTFDTGSVLGRPTNPELATNAKEMRTSRASRRRRAATWTA